MTEDKGRQDRLRAWADKLALEAIHYDASDGLLPDLMLPLLSALVEEERAEIEAIWIKDVRDRNNTIHEMGQEMERWKSKLSVEILERQAAEAGKREAEERAAALELRCFEGFPSVSDGIFDHAKALEAEVAQLKAQLKEIRDAWDCAPDDLASRLGTKWQKATDECVRMEAQLSDARAEIERLRGERDELAQVHGIFVSENRRICELLAEAQRRVEVLVGACYSARATLAEVGCECRGDGTCAFCVVGAALQGTEPCPWCTYGTDGAPCTCQKGQGTEPRPETTLSVRLVAGTGDEAQVERTAAFSPRLPCGNPGCALTFETYAELDHHETEGLCEPQPEPKA